MKNIFLIFLVVALAFATSCEKDKKETVIKETQSVAITEPNITDPYFDEVYIGTLSSIAGIQPSQVASELVFLDYYYEMGELNKCLFDKVLYFKHHDYLKFMQVEGYLNAADHYLSIGDEHAALIELELAYQLTNCQPSEAIVYEGQSYHLPFDNFSIIGDSIELAKSKIFAKYPKMLDLTDDQFIDFCIIAYLLNNESAKQKPQKNCCSEYRGQMLEIKSEMHTCLSVVNSYPLKLYCAIRGGLRGLAATSDYEDCVVQGGSGC